MMMIYQVLRAILKVYYMKLVIMPAGYDGIVGMQ